MARWSVNIPTWTTAATADTSTLANSTYMALEAGTGATTQRNVILEVYIGGQEPTSSKIQIMLLARNSTAASTPTAGLVRLAPLDVSTANLSTNPLGYSSATTGPQRSATLSLLNLSMNAFGGIVRWTAAPGEEIVQIGLAANTGSTSLTAFTGTTAASIGTHFIIEPF